MTGGAATVLSLVYLERDRVPCERDIDLFCTDRPWLHWVLPVALTILLILLLKAIWRPRKRETN